jgi:hypothetical protein
MEHSISRKNDTSSREECGNRRAENWGRTLGDNGPEVQNQLTTLEGASQWMHTATTLNYPPTFVNRWTEPKAPFLSRALMSFPHWHMKTASVAPSSRSP